MASKHHQWIIILVVVSLLLITPIRTDIEIRDQTDIISIESSEASFGHSLPLGGLFGRLIVGEPLDGCSKIKKAPLRSPLEPHWFVILKRSTNCTFQTKVEQATLGNYSGAIIFNDRDNRIFHMGGEGPTLVSSVLIGKRDGERMMSNYTYERDHNITMIIFPDEPFDLNVYLLPFAIVIGICFLLMFGIVIFKCIQDHRRNRRHRLPKSALKNLPIIKYAKETSPYDTCCICLDDYVNNDKLRILPCDHAYHKTCIDPWLVKNRRVCPQCRKKVFAESHGSSTPDSDDDDVNSENDALLQNVRSLNTRSGGTFAGSGTYAAAIADQISNSRSRFNFFGIRGGGRSRYNRLQREGGEEPSYIDNESANTTTPYVEEREEEFEDAESTSSDTMHVAIVHTQGRDDEETLLSSSIHSREEREEDIPNVV